MTIDVLYEHSFDIEFGSAGGIFLVDDPEDILPLTKEALDSRTLLGDPRIVLERTTNHEQYRLLKEIHKVDESIIKKILNNARKEAVKIRVKELKE